MVTGLRSAHGAVLTALGLLAAGAHTEAHRQEHPDFSGRWSLNWDLSDDPRQQAPVADVDRERRPDGPGSGGFGRGGFGGGGFGAPPPGDREEWSDERRTGLREALADLLTAPRRVTIAQDPREMLLTYDDGRYVRLVLDDREHAGLAAGVRVTRKARWEDDRLIAEVKLESNQKIVHELALRLAGDQLVLTTTLEPRGSQDGFQLRRVYDRVEE